MDFVIFPELLVSYIGPQILPRFVLEAEPKDLLRKKKQRDKAIDLIITECR